MTAVTLMGIYSSYNEHCPLHVVRKEVYRSITTFGIVSYFHGHKTLRLAKASTATRPCLTKTMRRCHWQHVVALVSQSRDVVDTWWRHQMETFSASTAICAGNSPVTGEFPSKRPATRGFDIFFDLHPNKRLSKQSWRWWFEPPSRPLWRRCNDLNKNLWRKQVVASWQV